MGACAGWTPDAALWADAWARLLSLQPAMVILALSLFVPGLVLGTLEWLIGDRQELRSQLRAAATLPFALGIAGGLWAVILTKPTCPGHLLATHLWPGLALSLLLLVLGSVAVKRARRRRKPLAPQTRAAASA